MTKRERPRRNWASYCKDMNKLVNRQAKGEDTVSAVDWLAVAIHRAGGPTDVAKQLHVSPTTIYAWLDKGVANVKFGRLVRLGELADMEVGQFTRRLGPFSGAQELAPPSRRRLRPATKTTG